MLLEKDIQEVLFTQEELEKRVRELQTMIAEDQLDIAFLTLTVEERTRDVYIPLCDEEILLVIPSGHPLSACAAPPGEPYAVMDLTQLRYEPFVLMDKVSTMRSLANDIFKRAGFAPNILFETHNNNTIIYMVQTNLCCGLVPSYYMRRTNDIAFFQMPDHPSWHVAASYKRNSYLSKPARLFIHMVKEHWNNNPFDCPNCTHLTDMDLPAR